MHLHLQKTFCTESNVNDSISIKTDNEKFCDLRSSVVSNVTFRNTIQWSIKYERQLRSLLVDCGPMSMAGPEQSRPERTRETLRPAVMTARVHMMTTVLDCHRYHKSNPSIIGRTVHIANCRSALLVLRTLTAPGGKNKHGCTTDPERVYVEP